MPKACLRLGDIFRSLPNVGIQGALVYFGFVQKALHAIHFLFGIGNAPAIFMVVVALFFHMVLATINQIDTVNTNFINVARTMGASKSQIYVRVIVPAILPGMLQVLRMNLFGAWMVVLVAESTGVGYGMGQVIMLARNTFNPSLVFFTIAVIGVLGFAFDWLLRQAQRRILYWLPDTKEKLRGL